MNNIKTQLMEEIGGRLENLKDIDIISESKDYETATNAVGKLFDKAIEMEKLSLEMKKIENEKEIKTKQNEDEKSDRIVKNILTAAGIIIPTGLTIWGTIASFRFEKEDTITTIIGRGFIQKLLPKK